MAARPRNIVVGYDGSAAAERALDAAADLFGYGSQLTIVTVQNGSPRPEVSNAARTRLAERHVMARYLEPAGEPAEALLEAASAIGADLVVVGRHDTVSSKVLGAAPCDVLVVR